VDVLYASIAREAFSQMALSGLPFASRELWARFSRWLDGEGFNGVAVLQKFWGVGAASAAAASAAASPAASPAIGLCLTSVCNVLLCQQVTPKVNARHPGKAWGCWCGTDPAAPWGCGPDHLFGNAHSLHERRPGPVSVGRVQL